MSLTLLTATNFPQFLIKSPKLILVLSDDLNNSNFIVNQYIQSLSKQGSNLIKLNNQSANQNKLFGIFLNQSYTNYSFIQIKCGNNLKNLKECNLFRCLDVVSDLDQFLVNQEDEAKLINQELEEDNVLNTQETKRDEDNTENTNNEKDKIVDKSNEVQIDEVKKDINIKCLSNPVKLEFNFDKFKILLLKKLIDFFNLVKNETNFNLNSLNLNSENSNIKVLVIDDISTLLSLNVPLNDLVNFLSFLKHFCLVNNISLIIQSFFDSFHESDHLDDLEKLNSYLNSISDLILTASKLETGYSNKIDGNLEIKNYLTNTVQSYLFKSTERTTKLYSPGTI